MRKGSTLFLRLVILLVAFLVLFLCVFILPRVIIAELAGDFDYLPILVGMYVPAIPFFIGIYNGLRLLDYIDKNKVFSEASVQALQIIKYCGFVISALYLLGMLYIFHVADKDDAPGVVLLGFIFIFASLVVGTAAAVFKNQLQKVIDIKSENELTV